MNFACGGVFFYPHPMHEAISSAIRSVGVDDFDLERFESQFPTPNGMAYNSYLILDERVAILDAVDARRTGEWLSNLEEQLAGRHPDYLVIHHMEPDHSGSLLEVLRRYPLVQLIGTARTMQLLGQFFEGVDFSRNTRVVGEGDRLPLGRHELHFYTAPMVHWPEVMVSYESSEKVLFSADAFGKFGAVSLPEPWLEEARRYYFNICGKYGEPVGRLLEKVARLAVRCIAPLHGPVLKEPLDEYLNLYNRWSQYLPETDGVLIASASIYGGTLQAAHRLAELLRERGVAEVKVVDLTRTDCSYSLAEAFRFSRLVAAAASYDGGLFPPMHDFLYHLHIKGYRNRRVALIENGSWGASATREMRWLFGAMRDVELLPHTLTIHSRLKRQDEASLATLADALLQ